MVHVVAPPTLLMSRSPRPVLLAAVACLAAVPAASASAAPPTYPSVSKVSPLKAGVGDTLTVLGKHFRSGKGRTIVVFKRTGGRAIFVKAGGATHAKLAVTIPAKMLTALSRKAGKPVPTRFRLRVLTGHFGRRYTAVKSSPVIGPAPQIPVKAVTVADCDGDQIPNATDPDDDNDLLSDTLEASLGTDPCKRDTDGDGMSDGWEQESALDYNGRSLPSPLKRPFPNALDPKDGAVDSDGDGLTNVVEYAAWATFGGGRLPLSYSGGNPASEGKVKPAPGREFADRDSNGFLSDNERDADGDGIPNQDEGGLDPLPVIQDKVGFFSDAYISSPKVRAIVDVVPLYGQLAYVRKVQGTSWLDTDSDGDTVADGADDQDGDGVSNLAELRTELATDPERRLQAPINPCEPYTDARLCLVGDDDIDHDGIANRDDDDDDGDRLTDAQERQYDLNPYKADTDGDGVGDGFEFYSAKDLNGAAVPYPSKQPYPNPLDPTDGATDHDGDGLSLVNEYRAWKYTGGALPLSYSDGNQRTGGGTTLDSYKDVDGDGASNFDEVAGPLSGPGFWTAWVKDNNIGCAKDYVESTYPGPNYQGLSFVDPDSDGDGILDGADDIDHDGLTNLEESRYVNTDGSVSVRRSDWCTVYVSVGPGDPHTGGVGADRYARTDPFNPCKPVNSDACHKFVPLNYYVKTDKYIEDWKGAEPNR